MSTTWRSRNRIDKRGRDKGAEYGNGISDIPEENKLPNTQTYYIMARKEHARVTTICNVSFTNK